MVPHVDVLICTPGRNMEAEYVKSLVETIKTLNQNNISFIYLNEYSSQVSAAREATIMGSRFLDAFSTQPLSGKVTYNKIIWIDSDISWTPEQFIRLYLSDYDIVSGVYYNEEGTAMLSLKEDSSEMEVSLLLKSTLPFEVFAVGFGFIAIKNGVFENISRPWFGIEFEKIENEDKTKSMYIPWGEDFSWCKKANDHGYKIYVDPEISVIHHKKIGLCQP